jgi:hypothetical protein
LLSLLRVFLTTVFTKAYHQSTTPFNYWLIGWMDSDQPTN